MVTPIKPPMGHKKPAARSIPPYDTGKVRIGLVFFPVQRGPLCADMHRLQTALLRPGSRSVAPVSRFDAVLYRFRNILNALGV